MKHLFLIILLFWQIPSFAQKWQELNDQGRQLRKERKFTEAIAALEKAKAEVEKKSGRTSKNYAIVINNLALVYDDMNNFNLAEPLYKEALAIYKSTTGEKDVMYVTTLENLGYLYQQQGKFKEAEEYYSQALAINKEVLGTKHPDYATSLENLAKLAEKSGQKDKAEKLYIEHLNLIKDNLGEKNPIYATAMENLAKYYQNNGNFRLAEDYFRDVLKVRKRNGGDKTVDYAHTLNNLAILYKVSGRAALAETTYEEALALYRATVGDKNPAYAEVVSNLANLYYSQANYKKAEQMYEESRKIIETSYGKNSLQYAMALRDLAKIHYVKSEYASAEPLYEEALQILKSRGSNNKEYAAIINDLASLYRMQGNEAKALPLLEESIKINKEILGDKHPEYARSLYQLAIITYKKEGASPKVEKMYQEVVEICRANPADANLYGNALGALANLYNNKGDFDKAEPLYKEGIKVSRQNLGKKHPTYARNVSNLAVLYRQKGKFTQAIEMFSEVAEIRKEVLGEKHLEYGKSLREIAELHYVSKDYAKAEPFYVESNRIFLDQINKNFATLSEKEKATFFRFFSNSFHKFNSFLLLRYKANPNLAEEAYNNQLVLKGLMLSEQNRLRNTIRSSGDSELISFYEEWQNKKDKLAQIYMKSLDEDVSEQKIKELESEIENLEKKLSLKSATFAQINKRKPATFKDVKNALGEDEVAIEMIRFNKFEYKFTDSVYYAAFITTKQLALPELVFIASQEKKEAEDLAFYRNSIRNRKTDALSYELFWKAISERVNRVSPNTKKIYLASDGIYYSINLATLYNPETKKYVLEERDIHNVISTRDIVGAKELEDNLMFSSAFLLGFPDFENDEEDASASQNADTTKVNLQEFDDFLSYKGVISNLPGTKKEIESIEKLFKAKTSNITKLMLAKANETQLKGVKSPSVLHIATHGYFMQDTDDGEEENGGKAKSKKEINPLMRSGLLLAGSQKTFNKISKPKEDGVLTAYEAQTLDLSNTNMVVLSACETAQGELKNGEGIFGLQRAFQVAGAKSVITSLWRVDDAATEMLMINFYTRWLKGTNKWQALKEAQKEVQKKYPQPYYWGAFVMVGN
jgi:CHAT domain-containing protein/Tfp pilus assembly protein PilF